MMVAPAITSLHRTTVVWQHGILQGPEVHALNEQAKIAGTGIRVRPRLNVKKSLLDWAIRRSSKSVESLSRNSKMKRIGEWMSGETKPTLRQMEAFADATYTPLGYLLLSEPPEEKDHAIPYFRTVAATTAPRPSLDLVDTIHDIEHRQDWMRGYLTSGDSNRLGYVNSANPTDPPADVACDMRRKMGMTEEWTASIDSREGALKALRDKIEDIGVCVATSGIVGTNTGRKLKVEEFRGFVLVDDYAPFVFVNGADAKAAQIFTLAHGLAHVWLGKSAVFDLHMLDPADDPVEHACSRIAAEFLVPEDQMRRVWGRSDGKPAARCKSTSQHYKVSEMVIARRALDLGLINRDVFDDIYKKQYKSDAKSGGKGGNLYASAKLRIGRGFGRAVISAAKNEEILYREAHHLTGLNRVTFEKYAEHMEDGSA